MSIFNFIKHLFTTLAFFFAAIFWGISAIPSVIIFTHWISIANEYEYWLKIIITGIISGSSLILWMIIIILLTGLLGWIFRPRKVGGGKFPLYSGITVRWGLLSVIQRLANPFASWFVPSWLVNLYYKLLGCRIGSGVIINSHRMWDAYLIEIKDEAIIGGNAVILGHLAEKDNLVLAPVSIGKGALIGAAAQINPGCIIGDGAVVASHALLPKYTEIPAGETWGGVPAKKIENSTSKQDMQ